jgi:RHS repeat-associated protein
MQTRSFDTQARMTDQSLGTLWEQSLTYDPNGNLTDRNVTSATGSQTDLFSYDSLDRITADTTQRGAFLYTYDANSNRLSKQIDGNNKAYDYSSNSNRLTQANNKTVVLDAAGNTLSDKNGKREFAYNPAGRLSQFTKQGELKATYTYNAFGQRTRKVKQTDNGEVTFTYHYDQHGHLIGEYKNGKPVRDYLWADAEPLMQVKIKPNGTIGHTTWITTDHLSTPRIGTDENQVIVWKREGAAFGQAKAEKDPDGDGKNRNIRLRFPGQLADSESGLYYNWNRYYDPGTGRYMTSDRIGLQGGINTFGYVRGNPLIQIDPHGLDNFRVHGFDVNNFPRTPAEAAAMQSTPLPSNANVIGLYGEAWIEFMSTVATVNGAKVITSCATKLLKVKPIQKLACTLGFTMAMCQGKGDVAHDIAQQLKRSNDIAQGSRVSQRATTHAPK